MSGMALLRGSGSSRGRSTNAHGMPLRHIGCALNTRDLHFAPPMLRSALQNPHRRLDLEVRVVVVTGSRATKPLGDQDRVIQEDARA